MYISLLLLSVLYHTARCGLIDPNYSINLTERLAATADRTYYIAAVDIIWDYTPNGTVNPFTGIPVNDDPEASIYTLPGVNRIGSKYIKSVYREFTDGTFTTMKARSSKWKHLGVLGPAIRGIVGERLKIVFFNNASGNFSMHPHGVKYNEFSEGAMYLNRFTKTFKDSVSVRGGQKVYPGQKWVYLWDVRDDSAGSSAEFSTKMWFYHSHIHETKDSNTGLVGPIIITKPGYARDEVDNLMPYDVDREFVTLFTTFNENWSWHLNKSFMKFGTGENGTTINEEYLDNFDFTDADWDESNQMYVLNGYAWGASSMVYTGIYKGERVRWYLGGMGGELDIHTAHWHGNIVRRDGFVYEDVVQLTPAFTTTVDMYAQAPGTWFYHCHVNEHVLAGMIGAYTVLNESCSDCVGNTYDDINESVVYETSGSDVSYGDVWMIVVGSFILNWILLGMIYLIYKKCCDPTPKRRYTGQNDELRENML